VAQQLAMMEADECVDRHRPVGRRHRHHLAVRGESHLGHGAYGLEHHQGIVKFLNTYGGNGTKDQECIWFSPACLPAQDPAEARLRDLFAEPEA
jgi:hypothetical protein